MKKYFYSAIAASMLFACSQEDIVDVTSGESQVKTFKVEIPQLESRTVGGIELGKGTQANTLIYAMYENDGDPNTPEETNPLITGVVTDEGSDGSDNGEFIVKVPMAKDLKYDLLFFAYNDQNSAFEIANEPKNTDLKNLMFKADQTANIDAFDAFVGSLKAQGVNDPNTVDLKRPFAQINAATTEADLDNATTLKLNVVKSNLVIEDVPQYYDVLNATASGSIDVTYDATAIMKCDDAATNGQKYPNEMIEVDGKNYYYLTLAYVLAGEVTTTSTHNATFEFQRENGTPVSTLEIVSLPIQRNFRTNVIGDLLTKSEEYTISIDAEFGGKHNHEVIPSWDGKTMTEPQKDATTGAYLVYTPAEYAWLFNYSNPISRAGTSLTGTIEIMDNIDLSGYEIGGITAARGGELTINGNGFLISNAVVRSGDNDNGTSSASMFVCLETSKLNINDLSVDNIQVITNEDPDNGYAGVIAAYVEGTLNLKVVHVSNSKVHSTQSIGSILGFVPANGTVTMENCTADGMVLTNADVTDESGAMGGLVGRVAGKLTVNGAKVSNTTIEAYVGTDSEQKRSISKYIGNLVGGAVVNITDAAIENVTIVAKNELAESQSCLYGDFLGGWRGTGGSVTINGVSIEKGESPFIETAEELSEALNNAADGATIGIGANIETKSLGSTGKNITIIGMTEDACIDASAFGFSTWTNVTAKNLTIKFNSSVDYYHTGINGNGTLTFDNCNFEGITTSMNGTFVYNNCTFTNTTKGKYAAWVYSGEATYNNCTFTGVDRAAKVYTEAGNSAKATYNDCTFNSSEVNKAAVEVDATNNNGQPNTAWYTININNAIINGLGEGELTGSVYCNIEGTNVTVNVDGKALTQAIRIGNKAYASLTQAIADAQDNDVILLADGTYTGLFTISNKNLTLKAVNKSMATIDGMIFGEGEKTVKLDGLTLKRTTHYDIPNTNAGGHSRKPIVIAYQNNFEIENCTFDMEGDAVYGFYDESSDANNYNTIKNCTFNCNGKRPIQAKTNITVDGCTFDDQYKYALQLIGQGDVTYTSKVIFTNNVFTNACKTSNQQIQGISISKNHVFKNVEMTIKGNTSENVNYVYDNGTNVTDYWNTVTVTGDVTKDDFVAVD